MSKVYTQNYPIPAATLGKDNPLPDIKNNTYIHAQIETTDAVSEEERSRIGTGMIPTLLPYTAQDQYDRRRKERNFNAVVLENEFLKAVFLPELGGRLWSLFDKETGRELLYRNPVFQPGNLALRNAWFSGGVEFNVSIKGHNPLTCSPIFARRLVMEDGSEGVRFYEYERIRGVAYYYDAWLPDQSRMLYIRPCIENRRQEQIWMYWWSNIAVPYTEKTRVIVPAREMFINYFGNDHYMLDSVDTVPYAFEKDVSYPKNLGRSLDFFYKIPADRRKWIAAVDKDGNGLVQCSTNRLIGRKLFVWGEGEGGKNWNRYLSDGSNEGYVEIQAGLAYTQLEHIPMPAGETWSWVEAYGAVSLPKQEAHGQWNVAQNAVETALDRSFSIGMLPTLDGLLKVKAQPGELLQMGSGWGALENMMREKRGLPSLSDACEFPKESLTEQQQEWITLLREGCFLEKSPEAEPTGYLVGEPWRLLLSDAIKRKENQHWYAYMQLGVMEYSAGHVDEARRCMEQSLDCEPNAWAARNLAMLWKNEYGDIQRALEYIRKAVSLNKTCRGILLDAAVIFLAAGKPEEWLKLYDKLDDSLKENGKLRYYTALCNMRCGDYTTAAQYLNSNLVMPDAKEGDTDLFDTWQELYGHFAAIELGTNDQEKIKKYVEEKYPLGPLNLKTH